MPSDAMSNVLTFTFHVALLYESDMQRGLILEAPLQHDGYWKPVILLRPPLAGKDRRGADGQSRLKYDSPPIALAGYGRLGSPGFPIMYGSQDIDVCIHECRASTESPLFS
ncbi:RES domain-containing protein [Pseudomonas sp. SK3(2021)]|nr:RES domain-containing protein [Pseudomonas sp. SK3(2021)]